jgi:S1-C subfamily serine protease
MTMQGYYKTIMAIGLVAALMAGLSASVPAAVYKYKKDGVWHFTDNPGDVPPSQLNSTAAPQAPHQAAADLKKKLFSALKPANEIERATLATVAIETSFGYGTGFFVTDDGYILTNKHVIRQMSGPGTANDPAAASRASALDRFEAQLQREMERLEEAHNDLAAFRRFIDGQPESPSRQYNESRYQEGLQRYRRWEKSLDEHQQKLSAERSAFEATLVQQRVDASLAGLNRNFSIYLADNTPLYAYVVEISEAYDLALLKVDGYTTPFLAPQNPFASAQGDPVYAIGNPVKLRNSVTSGVVSGFQGAFVKTNAQIYPGNSGGPLVTAQGRVIGINTFKKLTHKFEGLGFAISIAVAMDAFDAI